MVTASATAAVFFRRSKRTCEETVGERERERGEERRGEEIVRCWRDDSIQTVAIKVSD